MNDYLSKGDIGQIPLKRRCFLAHHPYENGTFGANIHPVANFGDSPLHIIVLREAQKSFGR